MAKTFKTFVQFEKMIEPLITKAIKITCETLLKELQALIMSEYYDVYDNETYKRTMSFYDSAVTEMLSDTVGMIFMNPDKMNYPFSGRGWSWTGEQQIEEANKGIHGGWSTDESLQHHYWDSFEEYCDKNAIKILRGELAKIGIKTTN